MVRLDRSERTGEELVTERRDGVGAFVGSQVFKRASALDESHNSKKETRKFQKKERKGDERQVWEGE